MNSRRFSLTRAVARAVAIVGSDTPRLWPMAARAGFRRDDGGGQTGGQERALS